MADHLTPAPRPAGYPAGYQNGRQDGVATFQDRHHGSYDMGGSSKRDAILSYEQTHSLPDDDDPLNNNTPQADASHDYDGHPQRDGRSHQKKRSRFSGSFLLQDTFGGAGRLLGSRRQRGQPPPVTTQTQANGSRDAGPRNNTTGSDHGLRQVSMPINRRSMVEPPVSFKNAPPSDIRRFSDSHEHEHERDDTPELDLDSTKLVHMALNLSESRRQAARRAASRSLAPPRLTPLPDATSSSNLRQHLQQQRKTSRNTPVKPSQETSPRIPPAPRLSGPFQPSFDAPHDAQYRWQFSASTLTRVQKAKEHLELLAQYRRLLEVLPPLKPGIERPGSSNPPASPVGGPRHVPFGAQASTVTLGRQCNPLQYIRNRKVRARERKIIDGERQGFDDAESVKSWVDMVYRQMSLVGTSLVEDKAAIPTYPGAEELGNEASPEPMAKTRSRRPRVDWFMEPCDMIADAYWLEQDGHKQLIEDRQWRKIFPSTAPDLQRPMSREVEDPSSKLLLPFSPRSAEQPETTEDNKESGLVKVRTDVSHSSTKERAKQKLQNITSFHHRHGSSTHGQPDLLRLKRGSMSEYSESDNEPSQEFRKKRPTRKATITSNTNDLLQKQMLEMVANEARERGLEESAMAHNESADERSILTLERYLTARVPSQFNSRRGSFADASDTDRKAPQERARFGSPIRQSLDVNFSVGSLGSYSSFPNSPELLPQHNGNIESIASGDLSPPWSRSASPARNPLKKIKQIIRDKSGESGDSQHEDVDENGSGRTSRRGSTAATPYDSAAYSDRRPISPIGQSGVESFRQHRPTGSARLRPDEIVGLRGMFKGPRIDTVLRGSVSKLGDIIRKKDGPPEFGDHETTDESDSDRTRGRQRNPPLPLSRSNSNRTQDGPQPKHFLDAMPQFQHVYESHYNYGNADNSQGPTSVDGSATHSRRSSRVDLLKHPRFDVRSASSSISPPVVRKRPGDSDISEPESFPGSVPDGVRDADRRLNSAIALGRVDSQNPPRGRHWSIVDRDMPDRTMLSKKEVARMRTLMLSSGIKAMEIRRRANERHKPFSKENLAMNDALSQKEPGGIVWSEIATLTPRHLRLHDRQVAFHDVYPLAAQTLRIAIQAWGQRWQSSADYFTNRTTPELRNRVWEVRARLADDLSEMTRKAADEADETSRELALGQPLKVKHVLDLMEKMLRRRRRRFRWLRRGMWLTVEWLLVGFMWYVWFVVTILRVFLGLGKGFWKGVKWLFFL